MHLSLLPLDLTEEISYWLPDVGSISSLALCCRALYMQYNCMVYREVPVQAFITLALPTNAIGPHPASHVRNIVFQPTELHNPIFLEIKPYLQKTWAQLDHHLGTRKIQHFSWTFLDLSTNGCADFRPLCLGNLITLQVDLYQYNLANFDLLVCTQAQ